MRDDTGDLHDRVERLHAIIDMSARRCASQRTTHHESGRHGTAAVNVGGRGTDVKQVTEGRYFLARNDQPRTSLALE